MRACAYVSVPACTSSPISDTIVAVAIVVVFILCLLAVCFFGRVAAWVRASVCLICVTATDAPYNLAVATVVVGNGSYVGRRGIPLFLALLFLAKL